jgi:hypothetical protein
MEIDPALASGAEILQIPPHTCAEKTHQSDKIKKLCNLDDNLKKNCQMLQSLSIARIAFARGGCGLGEGAAGCGLRGKSG